VSEPDHRRVTRIVVDRVPWSLSYAAEGESDLEAPYGLGRDEVVFVREHLAPVPVWDPGDVTRSLPPDE
jgi:hypothetical protein